MQWPIAISEFTFINMNIVNWNHIGECSLHCLLLNKPSSVSAWSRGFFDFLIIVPYKTERKIIKYMLIGAKQTVKHKGKTKMKRKTDYVKK